MKPIAWGIIGCGDIADKSVAPAINGTEDSVLMAVMRRNEEKAREFAKKHRAKRFYTTAEDLLKDEEVDAVSITTPPDLHFSQTVLAAEFKKHVLCEKPMGMNAKECKKMIEVCQREGVALGVSYYRRFYPKVQKMKELLNMGEVGKPVLIRCQYAHWYNPPPEDPKAWRLNPTISGGGVLMDAGSHRLDLMVQLLGLPSEVSAFASSEIFHHQVEESMLLMLTFRDGAQGIANFNWNTKSRTNDFDIYGTEGKMVASPLEEEPLLVYAGEKVKKSFSLPRPKIAHLPVIQDFVRALRTGREPLISGKEGMKTSQVMEAAYLSAQRGKKVMIEGWG